VDSRERGGFTVTTSKGTVLEADNVLIAAGAFVNFRHLLPLGLQLDIQLLTAQTAKAEVSEETALRLSAMPSMIYKDPTSFWAYILPPIKYPDGKIYLKLGGGFHSDNNPSDGVSGLSGRLPAMVGTRELNNEEEVLAWYRSKGDAAHHEKLMRVLSELFPSVEVLGSHSDSCVTAHTPTKQLYIGEVSNSKNGGSRMMVATGGNGYAAKSADAIGLLAAFSCIGSEAGPRAVELAGRLGLQPFAPLFRQSTI